MDDYIKREEVYDQLDRWARDLNYPKMYQRDDARCVIDGIPSADVAPVRHGMWVDVDRMQMHDLYGVLTWGNSIMCTECNFKTFAVEGHMSQYHYCPNCGARMDAKK